MRQAGVLRRLTDVRAPWRRRDPGRSSPLPISQNNATEAVYPPDLDRGSIALTAACAAFAIDVTLEAEALQAGAAEASLAPTPIQALVAEVMDMTEAYAGATGVRLMRDVHCGGACEAIADAPRLRKVLVHLLLQNLSAPGVTGVLRVMVTLEPSEVRIVILASRPQGSAWVERAHHGDLYAAEVVLAAMGARLVVEPSRFGHLPLCVVLAAAEPGPCAAGAADRRAA